MSLVKGRELKPLEPLSVTKPEDPRNTIVRKGRSSKDHSKSNIDNSIHDICIPEAHVLLNIGKNGM
jgi:hypothetical protein